MMQAILPVNTVHQTILTNVTQALSSNDSESKQNMCSAENENIQYHNSIGVNKVCKSCNTGMCVRSLIVPDL